MLAQKQNLFTAFAPSSSSCIAHTTLYDVIEAVAEAAGPGEKELIGAVVKQILKDYRARFEFNDRNGSKKTADGNHHLRLCRGVEA